MKNNKTILSYAKDNGLDVKEVKQAIHGYKMQLINQENLEKESLRDEEEDQGNLYS